MVGFGDANDFFGSAANESSASYDKDEGTPPGDRRVVFGSRWAWSKSSSSSAAAPATSPRAIASPGASP